MCLSFLFALPYTHSLSVTLIKKRRKKKNNNNNNNNNQE